MRPFGVRPPRTRQTDTATEFWAEFWADYWPFLLIIVLVLAVLPWLFLLPTFLQEQGKKIKTKTRANIKAGIKANLGIIFCSAWVAMIIVIACFFAQNGLPDKLKTIALGSVENSKVIRNYFLIFVAIAGAPFLVWRSIIASRNAKTASSVADTNRNNQITQAYSTAIEQLGSTYSDDKPNTETRLGAIYTLEKIALSNEDYQLSIIEILASYVRQNSQNKEGKKGKNEKISIIIQTISTVIKRIRAVFDLYKKNVKIDLNNCNLMKVDLRGADLSDADLSDTDLAGADLRDVKLWRADLWNANLRGADLRGADLWLTDFRLADLRAADLRNADLRAADLRNADLKSADLRAADLRRADLTDADLKLAELTDADLTDADLTDADLTGADLRGADLTNIRIDNKTKFPKGYEKQVKNVSFQKYDKSSDE